MTGKPAVLVDIASATHGRPWELEGRYILAINRAHSDLVKFSKQDEDYEVVLHHLRRFSSVSASVIRDRFKADSASSRFFSPRFIRYNPNYRYSSIITSVNAGYAGLVFSVRLYLLIHG
jgi:hypothetical protein